MQNKIKLFDIPFVSQGAAFGIHELNVRIERFFEELKVLIPKIDDFSLDLDYELHLVKEHLLLSVFIHKKPQLALPILDECSLCEIKIIIVEELKRLPLSINLAALQTFSVEQDWGNLDDGYTEKMKQLMKKKQKETLRFLLEDDEISLGFPEMAPCLIDHSVRLIRFNIDYIHREYFRIKLLSDSLSESTRKRYIYLKVRDKIHDDSFYAMCTEALRSRKLIELDVFCYRDAVTNDILMYQA